jgi:hypothetical protein
LSMCRRTTMLVSFGVSRCALACGARIVSDAALGSCRLEIVSTRTLPVRAKHMPTRLVSHFGHALALTRDVLECTMAVGAHTKVVHQSDRRARRRHQQVVRNCNALAVVSQRFGASLRCPLASGP